jgi:hypothetical protein
MNSRLWRSGCAVDVLVDRCYLVLAVLLLSSPFFRASICHLVVSETISTKTNIDRSRFTVNSFECAADPIQLVESHSLLFGSRSVGGYRGTISVADTF